MTEHRLISFDKTPLFYRRFTPQGQPKASLLIIHGMGEHGGRYKHLAEYLLPLGVESFAPDLRGFGQSGGARAYVEKFDVFLNDLDIFYRYLLRQDPKRPVFLLGHSLGGLISAAYAVSAYRPALQGLLLSSPAFGVSVPVPIWRNILARAMSLIWPCYSENDGLDIKLLSHDPEILKEYQKDTLINHRVTARLYCELLRAAAQKNEIAAKLKLPLLVMQAGEDTVVKKGETLLFYDRAASADKELKVYEGFYHEILNETEREKVFALISAWLLSKF